MGPQQFRIVAPSRIDHVLVVRSAVSMQVDESLKLRGAGADRGYVGATAETIPGRTSRQVQNRLPCIPYAPSQVPDGIGLPDRLAVLQAGRDLGIQFLAT